MLISFHLDQTIKRIYIYIIGSIISFIPIIIIRVNKTYYKNISDFLQMTKFIAGTLNIIPYLLSNYICKNKQMKINILSKNAKSIAFTRNDYIIFFLIISINFIFFIIDRAYDHFFHTFQSIELFILSFLMKTYSEFKFFRHKVFGLLLFSISSIFLDYVKGIKHFTFADIVIGAIDIVLDSVDYSYKKYLMDVKFMSPYKVVSILYFTYLIDVSIYEIIGKIFGNFIYINDNVSVALTRIKKNISISLKILKSIPLIISYMLFYSFFYVVIAEATVIHGEIINIILPLIITLINSYEEKSRKTFALMVLCNFFLVVSLLIYIEIIELNFWGLNTNVRRNILDREKFDQNIIINAIDEDDEIENKEIEVVRGYSVELDEFGNEI